MKGEFSKTIVYQEPITLENICLFFEKAQTCRSSIALCREGRKTPVERLSSMVPFFLKLKKGDRYSLVAEGESAEQDLSMIPIS
ncbi:MAG TPA: hypothetical protein VFK37_03930 [Bacillales bacterium]|nr:hypothetical protein [Bacillales bacterium]